MEGIIIAAVVIGVTGIIIGIFLGVSGKKLYVAVDERITKVKDLLPGNNCGGCGYAGCDACAKAIVDGVATPNACSGCSDENVAEIGKILGVEAVKGEKKIAFAKCAGDCDAAKNNYDYSGVADCRIAAQMQSGGPKGCAYGCLGFGTCSKACPYDAITMVNGIPKVDAAKCVGCGSCVLACPRNIMAVKPESATVAVKCSSHDKGKDVMNVCKVGCIGCTLCVKECEFGAIAMDNNVPVIDYDKCTKCGKCAAKCPKKIIKVEE